MAFLQSLGKLAPTIGGILGGIGGEIVDPFGGGIAGAALGSGLGKGVENASQGQNPIQGNDLVAAAEGGVGQGTGDILGGLLGKAGGAIGGFGARQGEKVAEAQGLKDLSNEFPGITTQTEKDLNFAGSLSHAGEMGIPNTTEAWLRYGNAATGPDGIYTKTLDNIANSQGPVDLSTLPGKVDSIIQKYKGSLNNPDATAALIKQRILNAVEPGAGDTITNATIQGEAIPADSALGQQVQSKLLPSLGSTNPDQALNAMRNIREGMWRPLVGKANGNDAALRGAYQDAMNTIRDSVYSKPEIQDAVKNFTVSPELKQEILDKTNGDEQMASYIEQVLNGAKTPSDITSEQAQAINMRDSAQISHDLKTKTVMGGPQAKAIMQAAEEPGVAEQAAAHGLTGNKSALLGMVTRAGTNPKMSGPIARRMGGILDRMSVFTGDNSGVLNKLPGAAGTTIATSPNAIGGPQQGANMMPQQMPGMPGAAGLTGPNAGQSPLLAGYNDALGMMTMDPYLASSLAPVVSSLAPGAQKLTQAANLLPSVEQAYQAAGGGQGPILGGLSRIGGALTGGPSATYSRLQAQLQALLGQLGLPGSYVPGITQNAPSGALGFGGLQSLLAGVPPTQ